MSLYLVAFQSGPKIRWFKHLIFGTNSAVEKLQITLRNILADIAEAINIAENIFIFAKKESEHDEILRKVLHKCKETGIILYLRKCLFCKTSLEIYGFIFSKEGMKLNLKKVEEIKNAKSRDAIHALRRFFGLANHMEQFISDFIVLTARLRGLLKEGTICLDKKDQKSIWKLKDCSL